MWRVLIIALVCAVTPALADPAANTVALLPLDAESRLEIYGKPVASELARALGAAGVTVTVVGASLPDDIRLIVDGSIKARGNAVVLAIRVRTIDGEQIGNRIEATAANIGAIDRAAAELATRVVPIIQAELAKPIGSPLTPRRTDPKPIPNTLAPSPLLVAIGISSEATAIVEPLRIALGESVATWVRSNRKEPRAIELSTLHPALATRTVAMAKVDRAIAFEVIDYWIDAGIVPLARARVRVRIADANGIAFDRVVVTDTVVGDKGISAPLLADRVAREVLAILKPHMRRLEPTWR